VLALADGAIVLAATDLTNHLACAHLTQQRLAIARGARALPRPADDPHAELLRRRGDAHEREQLRRLAADCGGVADLTPATPPRTRAALEDAAARTADAMQAGARLIYQAQLFDGRWQGRADFLRRTPEPSALGGFSYEVLDTKLARHVTPRFVHQLALYGRLLGTVQGREPTTAYVILGDGSVEPVEVEAYAALHRHAARRLEEIVAAPGADTYPEPVAHCPFCGLVLECDARWRADDHLSLVAFARRAQRERLAGLGLGTVAALAAAPATLDCRPLDPAAFALLRHQAALQVASRSTGQPTRRHLPPAGGAGYARLPEPSAGDVFFDLEGDPYVADGGLEYLWGWWTDDGYEHVFAHDRAEEKAALERFVDGVCAIRARHPGMHVYHYAPHEASTLRSLALAHATREDEVDDLLRNGVLVDLYAIVRGGLQVGEESYSLKRLERHHGFHRTERSVREGGGSIVAYETWLETGDDALLEAIRAYNEDDCRSTRSLRDWLHDRLLPEAAAEFGVDPRTLAPDAEPPLPAPAWLADVEALQARLRAGGDAERDLVADLLLYHRRESKPEWWRHYELLALPPAELEHERDALGGLVRLADVPPEPHKRSLDYAFGFPAQEFKLDVGQVLDPETRRTVNLARIEDDRVWLRAGVGKAPPAPRALIPRKPIDGGVLREAIVAFATDLADGDDASPAARAILRREPPRLRSGTLGPGEGELVSATLGLDASCLPVQGPPGTGKTFLGARMIVAGLRAGLRIGVTAFSHAAIQNLLRMVEDHAHAEGVVFRGIYKGHGYASPHDLVASCDDNKDADAGHDLVAGTAWLFARPEHRGRFDRLFVDEAGQFALANAVAAAPAADSVILLGDPQQLPQVTQATHPGGSGASVLEHLLAGRATVEPSRGVLLDVTWRMHPAICAFVSERSYDGLLRSRDACARRRIDAPGSLAGAGPRLLAVEHEGRSQASIEEARAIARACERLLDGGTVTDADGATRRLRSEDVLVVAPYNMARRVIAHHVPPGVRVGTVDRFQGQEAPVVFFAMTCSSGDDVPRGLDFLFDGHRLNVAVSRAQCLAVVVLSPRLLDADCRTLETMRLVDGVCRFAELAAPVGA
jgi:predicted RecB family nuclease